MYNCFVTTREEEDREGKKEKKIWAADFRSDHAYFQNSNATTEKNCNSDGAYLHG